MVREWKYRVLAISGSGTTTINDVPTLLLGVYVNIGSGGARIHLLDDASIVYRIPANSTDGDCYAPGRDVGVRFETSLVVGHNSSSGEIVLQYDDLERS
jgi:hypothetical protein|tara:strand:+ start:106 stop:402 length:297 start_codon:yes stop_codon:yes gene_type:complete